MKRIILLLVAVLFAQCAFAQTPADTLRKQQMQMDWSYMAGAVLYERSRLQVSFNTKFGIFGME